MAALRSRPISKPQVPQENIRCDRASSFFTEPQQEQVLLDGYQRSATTRVNDLARSAMGVACTVDATVGFWSLSASDQSRVRELVETFDAFDQDNDPHGERVEKRM